MCMHLVVDGACYGRNNQDRVRLGQDGAHHAVARRVVVVQPRHIAQPHAADGDTERAT